MFKNKKRNDDMIEILTELHEKYLPLLKTTDDSGNEQVEILQRLFFGGDQLTEERACNARQGNQVKGKVGEQWNKIFMEIFRGEWVNSSSVCDVGTMCSNMNVTNQLNAKTSNLETDAFIVTATMKHFGMTTLEDPVDQFIPASILQGTRKMNRPKVYHCSACGKEYRYQKA
ncbi:unnamed protein product [Porites evermanni]|uniref:Uncharacterized protein n=1 Tax=Porites evermanni TaxID=104178 RepID=A0ABN8PF67_9CNID|nr:unnamed protein product [Porites evermanni]